jgi:trimeric autotransporter adhesin
MNFSQRIGFLLFAIVQVALCGCTQHERKWIEDVQKLPVNGAQAITQVILVPNAVAVDGAGNFYVSSYVQNAIFRVAADGSISVKAGVGAKGYDGDRGLATAAKLNYPCGMAVDSAGSLYIADIENNRIRKVTSAGIISTVAGNGNKGYSGDGGPATLAKLNEPFDVAVDSAGNLYIADFLNGRVRKVTHAGIISTVAGNGPGYYSGDGGLATAAGIGLPWSVTVDSAGNLYIAGNEDHRIRKVTPAGIISTVATEGTHIFNVDSKRVAMAPRLFSPTDLAVDSAGNLFIADQNNHLIFKLTPAGIMSIVAGNGTNGYSGDGGLATAAKLSFPRGVAVDSAGNLYIADESNELIRKVTPAGIITTVAGKQTYGAAEVLEQPASN